jgi:hypothetical protein
MTVTYEAIASHTVTGTSTTALDFSVPSTYTDLVLVSSAAISASGFSLVLRVGTAGSADTGSNYSRTYIIGTGSGNGISGRDSNSTSIDLNGSSYTSGTPATTISQFMNYANTTTNKTILIRADGASDVVEAEVGLYRSTSALNFIRIFVASGYIFAGSTFSLYGIKAE